MAAGRPTSVASPMVKIMKLTTEGLHSNSVHVHVHAHVRIIGPYICI